jgi:hypothetical protein
VKKTRKKKENVEPKKNDTESQADADLGRLNLRKHVIAKRREYLAERKKYEKEYLARLKKRQKAKPKKSSSLKPDADLGRLNLRKHVIAKRREYLAERKKYEKEYLARLMKRQKAKPKKSSSLKPDADLGRLNLRKHVIAKRREYLAERKKYEKEYLARLKKRQKAKPKKKKSLSRKR